MPINGCEQPFGMPTAMMANLHNSSSTYADPLVNASSPLQGYGFGVNNLGQNQPLGMGLHTQMSNLTDNFVAVLRQQMDKSNHEMVQMLAQTMGIIFNLLIQNTTHSNQKMATQITRIADFFGISQPPRQPQKEWIRENQGLAIEVTLPLTKSRENAPQANVVN